MEHAVDDSPVEDEYFGDSESQKETFSANMHGAISDAQAVNTRQSAESVEKIDAEVELNEDEDDFMATYLAINLDVKVRES